MSRLHLDQPEFLFHSEGLRAATLHVLHFRGREALSEPFAFIIELVSNERNIDLEAPLGRPALLTLYGHRPDGTRYERLVYGLVGRFSLLHSGPRFSRYRAQLVPTIQPLQLGRNARAFAQQSAPAVALAVLRAAGVPSTAIHSMLHDEYPQRELCVQYQESDLSFLRRLWEEEGICFFFTHGREGDVLNLGDGSHAFAELPSWPAIELRDCLQHHDEGLTELEVERALRADTIRLRDFRFQQPALDLEVAAHCSAPQSLPQEIYDYPGRYDQLPHGQRLAIIRLQAEQWPRQRYLATGNVRAMQPGCTFSLHGHRRSDCNRDYLIVAVEHEGSQPQALHEEAASGPHCDRIVYRNRIECIPATTPFRPQRQTTSPRIVGAQTATVVAPAGEEIHCDRYGRVQVQFHWQRPDLHNEYAGAWVRVSQLAAGSGYGGLFLPRCGQEVVVQFLDGDPDRPLIVGRVYNGENPPPQPLPAAKHLSTIRTASTPGGTGYNELRFDDRRGREQIHLHAERDLDTAVGQHQHTTIGANQTLRVHGAQSTTIESGDRTVTVLRGSSALRVQGHRNVTVHGGSHNLLVESGDSNHTVNSGHHTTLVRSGHSTLIVAAGHQSTEVHSGHHSLKVGAGDSRTEVASGEQSTIAKKTVTVASRSERLRLLAATDWQGEGGQSATLSAPEIRLTAAQSITLQVGDSVLSLSADGLRIAAAEIESSAVANHTISGAIVRIN